MKSAAGPWTAPLAVALYVFALLFGTHAAFTSGGGGGGGPDRNTVPEPPLPTVVAHATILPPAMVAVRGYRTSARTLTITFTVLSKECSRLVIEPDVRETA